MAWFNYKMFWKGNYTLNTIAIPSTYIWICHMHVLLPKNLQVGRQGRQITHWQNRRKTKSPKKQSVEVYFDNMAL